MYYSVLLYSSYYVLRAMFLVDHKLCSTVPPAPIIYISLRIVLAMASSSAMVTTYSGVAQQKREVDRV